jgi:hypothetical protein
LALSVMVVDVRIRPDEASMSVYKRAKRPDRTQAVDNLPRLTGVSGPELIAELSLVLPGVIDRLTPHGRMPDQAEMAHW